MRLVPALLFEAPDLRIEASPAGGAAVFADGAQLDPEGAVEVAFALLEVFGPEGILEDLRSAVRTRRLRLVTNDDGGAA